MCRGESRRWRRWRRPSAPSRSFGRRSWPARSGRARRRRRGGRDHHEELIAGLTSERVRAEEAARQFQRGSDSRRTRSRSGVLDASASEATAITRAAPTKTNQSLDRDALDADAGGENRLRWPREIAEKRRNRLARRVEIETARWLRRRTEGRARSANRANATTAGAATSWRRPRAGGEAPDSSFANLGSSADEDEGVSTVPRERPRRSARGGAAVNT